MSKLNIFAAGTHTDMHGTTISFSANDIAATAAAYDPALHEAPIVVGHPTHDAPAYGWIAALDVTNTDLNATPKQVDAAFAEMVTAGRFKKISASFYSPDHPANPVKGVWYLRHVGFLGALAPAIKGLKPVAFADQDGCTSIEMDLSTADFGEYEDRVLVRLLRRLKNWFVEKEGQAKADQIIDEWELESLTTAALTPEPDNSNPAFGEPIPNDNPNDNPTKPNAQETNTVTPEEKAAIEAKNAQLEKELAELKQQQAQAAKDKLHTDNVNFAENLVNQGKLEPKHKAVVIASLDVLAQNQTADFGEGEQKTTLVGAFKAALADNQTTALFGELATKDKIHHQTRHDSLVDFGENVDEERLQQHREITQLMETKGMDYQAAANQVMSKVNK